MMPNIYLVAYLIGYIAIYPRVFRYMLEDMVYGTPDKEDILFNGVLVGLLCVAWPFIVLGAILYKVVLEPIAERVQREYRK